MELGFSTFSMLLTFLFFVFMFLKKRSKTFGRTFHLPPGPWKLPLIGSLHHLVGSLPHHRLRDLAKQYGPFMHLQLGEISAVVVSSPEFAKEVMRTHDVNFASRPRILAPDIMSYGSTDIAFAPYGDYWRQLRKICTLELLSTKRVLSFRFIREEEVSTLVDWIASKAGSPVNLTEKVHSLTYGITSRAAFGNKWKDQDLFISIIKEASVAAGGFNIADLFPSIKFLESVSGIRPKLEKMHKQTDRIIENIINEHKKGQATLKIGEEDEDLVDVLIYELKLDIFSAGSETSATTVDWAMCEMMKNTKILEKAQAEVREVFRRKGKKIDEASIEEMKFLKLVIKETLRLHPPAPLLIPRECREACVINGFDVPIKTRLMVNAWAIGRHPKYWTEPESFIPERFLDCSIDYKGKNFEFIPFGSGRRVCPGISFGLANVELPLAMLLYHFDWKLPKGMKNDDFDMTECFGMTVRRKDDLCLIPIPYHP